MMVVKIADKIGVLADEKKIATAVTIIISMKVRNSACNSAKTQHSHPAYAQSHALALGGSCERSGRRALGMGKRPRK